MKIGTHVQVNMAHSLIHGKTGVIVSMTDKTAKITYDEPFMFGEHEVTQQIVWLENLLPAARYMERRDDESVEWEYLIISSQGVQIAVSNIENDAKYLVQTINAYELGKAEEIRELLP